MPTGEHFTNNLTFKPISTIKKIRCKMIGHDFNLTHGKNGELPMRVYTCRYCGKMSFKVKEHIIETPIINPVIRGYDLFTNMMFYSVLAIFLRTIAVVFRDGLYRFF